MLVRAKIIDNAVALPAENHVGVETAGNCGFKCSDPSHRLATMLVYIRIILDRERYRFSLLRKHDSPPATDVQEWHCVERTVPNLVHRSGADAGNIIPTAEPKPLLDTRMEMLKLFSKCLFVDGLHDSAFRRQFPALEDRSPESRLITARVATERFRVTGLNAAVRKLGDAMPTASKAETMAINVNQSGQRDFQKTTNTRAKQTSMIPKDDMTASK